MGGTIFCDIDGVIFSHNTNTWHTKDVRILQGTWQQFDLWRESGYYVVITTGRRESMRGITETQLKLFELDYDLLIMGLPRGKRVVINDRKPGSSDDMAVAINLDRDEGMKDVPI